MEYVILSNGVKMPVLGYGVYQVEKEECERRAQKRNFSHIKGLGGALWL